jgi:hypothetical protein
VVYASVALNWQLEGAVVLEVRREPKPSLFLLLLLFLRPDF